MYILIVSILLLSFLDKQFAIFTCLLGGYRPLGHVRKSKNMCPRLSFRYYFSSSQMSSFKDIKTN